MRPQFVIGLQFGFGADFQGHLLSIVLRRDLRRSREAGEQGAQRGVHRHDAIGHHSSRHRSR